jgi:hypothetical protein
MLVVSYVQEHSSSKAWCLDELQLACPAGQAPAADWPDEAIEVSLVVVIGDLITQLHVLDADPAPRHYALDMRAKSMVDVAGCIPSRRTISWTY